jgi:cellobiose-specific phosphotransferase system component IIB
MTIKSKHDDLLNYFIYDNKDLSKEYVRQSKKFLKSIKNKKVINIFKKVNNIKGVFNMIFNGLNGFDLFLIGLFVYISYRLIKRAIKEKEKERINNIKIYDYRKVNNEKI